MGDHPRSVYSEYIWEEAMEKLGDADPWLAAVRAVGHDDGHLDVLCPDEVVVSWIKGSYGERLGEILAPRELHLIHGEPK